MIPPQQITLSDEHWQQILADIRACAPNEACGLIAGETQMSVKVFSIQNELASPVRFRMDPQQQLDAMLEMEEKNWVMLAIYHSHPQGPAFPSETDVAEAAYPETANLIVHSFNNDWQGRAFLIREGKVLEIPLLLCD
jgi:proteasome lid subunit RPN8/RPN11